MIQKKIDKAILLFCKQIDMWLLSLAEMMICCGTISDCSILTVMLLNQKGQRFYPSILGKGPWPKLGKNFNENAEIGLNNILFVTRHVYYSTEISWYRI